MTRANPLPATRVIDMRCRPPLPEFRQYFDLDRIAAQGARTGAPVVSRAFVEGSMELFFEEMDEAGIALAVVQGRNSPERFMGVRFNASYIANDRIAELQRRHPDRFVGFAGIDCSNTVHDAVAETRRCLADLGLRGIFVEPGRALGAAPDDERLFPIYEQCMAAGAPVSIMTGPYAGPDIAASAPVSIDRLATRFPALTIICGHGCWPYAGEIVAVAFKHRGVYVSPDMYLFAPGAAPYVEAANAMLRGQMLFGSAYPLRPMGQSVAQSRELPFTADALSAYLYDNAARLLGVAPANG